MSSGCADGDQWTCCEDGVGDAGPERGVGVGVGVAGGVGVEKLGIAETKDEDIGAGKCRCKIRSMLAYATNKIAKSLFACQCEKTKMLTKIRTHIKNDPFRSFSAFLLVCLRGVVRR